MQFRAPFARRLAPLCALAFALSLTACGDSSPESDPIVIDTGAPSHSTGGADAGPTDTGQKSPDDPETDTGSAQRPDADDPGPDPVDDTGVAPTPDASPSEDTGDDVEEIDPEDCYGSHRMCDGKCIELLSNPDHCGACDWSCGDGESCVNGSCRCAAGEIRCNGKCIDPESNDDHCFTCNNACGPGMTCRKSVCMEEDRVAAVLKLTNQARQTSTDCGKYGVKPPGPTLTVNKELEKAAQAYAERMAKHQFMAHTDPIDGSSFVQRVNRTNYTGYVVGENLARGLRQTAKVVVDGWIMSDGHCRNLANPNVTEIGIGMAETDKGQFDAYWVQLFGRRSP